MTDLQKTILSLVGSSLFGSEPTMYSDDYKGLFYEAMQQAVFTLIYPSMPEMPTEADEIWKKMFRKISLQNVNVVCNHSFVDSLLTNSKIPYVILKGCASAAYYKEPELRMMGDVDFLVSPENLEKAGEIFTDAGFTSWAEEHDCHIVYKKEKCHLEMHFEPSGVPEGKAGELIREYLSDIFEHTQIKENNGEHFLVPGDFHHGLVLLIHTCHHLLGEGVGLRHLCDWAVFASSLSESEFTDLFEEKLKKAGLWRFAQVLYYTSMRYIFAPYRAWADIGEDALALSLIEDILSGGNFGRKDSDREIQSNFISSRGKNGVGNSSMLKQLFISLNHTIGLKWPIAKKIKLIYPFGWVYFGLRYLVRVLFGKRKKIDITKTVKASEKRKEIYEQFDIYK